jgi:mannose-6-phosphate isomerase-like protein (cupin superfamily)
MGDLFNPGSGPQVISTARAEHYIWGGQCDGWHLAKRPGLSVIEERMPAGSSETLHRHAQSQQFFYVLSGEATFIVEGALLRVGPGEGLGIAPGSAHLVRNAGASDLRFLVISQPPSRGDREELAQETR